MDFDDFNDFLTSDDKTNNDIISFHELLALEQRCKKQEFSQKASSLKNYFKNNLHLINDPQDFEGFRPLLDKILEKLELK